VPHLDEADRDTLMQLAAFEHVRRLSEIHDHLTGSGVRYIGIGYSGAGLNVRNL
jgi:hypothetical protein